jgi:chromosome segregation ATPase
MTSETETTERELVEQLRAEIRTLTNDNARWQESRDIFAQQTVELKAQLEHSASREAALVGHLKNASAALEEADRLAPTDKDGEYFQRVQSEIDAALSDTSPAASRLLKIESAAKKLALEQQGFVDALSVTFAGTGRALAAAFIALKDALLTGASNAPR